LVEITAEYLQDGLHSHVHHRTSMLLQALMMRNGGFTLLMDLILDKLLYLHGGVF
jgi:hypothetical protein